MHILVVEDDLSMRLTLQVFLKDLGDTDTAHNGQEALEKIERQIKRSSHFDLICLDIKMEGLSGVDVLHRLRIMEHEYGITETAKVLMTTSQSDKRLIEASVREQCNGYLLKPFDKAMLMDYLMKFNLISSIELSEQK